MPINGTFIVGYEGETEEDLKATIDLVIDEEINSGASLLYIYPGTSLYANALRKGVIKDEIEFLKKSMMSFENALFSPEGKEEYYNVSQIPDKDFFKIVISEVRRYYTFLFTRYPVNKLSFQIEIKNTKAVISMTGNCHECNTFVSYEYGIFKGRQYSGSLGEGINDRLVCQNCFTRLSFDIYKCNNHWKLPNHFDSLKEQMIGKNRIIIAGINQDLNFLLRINLFNINYDKILGIISVDNNYKGSTYLNYPVLNTDEAVDLKPDLVIWLDIFNDTRYILKKFKEKNISPQKNG